MSQLKLNIVANFAGKGWSAFINLALVPFYIKFMGVEAWALVGIYLALLNLFSLLDLGMSTILNRELARLTIQSSKAQEARHLVRTLEIVYWGIAIALVIILLLLAPIISNYWVHPHQLSVDTVQKSLSIVGLVIGFQFPFALYSGGLLGLQRQVLLNGLLITMTTLRGGGVVLILWLVSPTVEAYFSWQLFISLIQTGLGGLLLWANLPRTEHKIKPRFQKNLIFSLWRFGADMTAITFLSLLLTQTDKLILSNLLSLEMFGYYNLASLMASGLLVVITPIFTAVFPRFSQLVLSEDENGVKNLYHKSSQLLAVILLPLAIILALFAPEVLWIWQGSNKALVENTHLLASLLIIGTALNGLMNVPYALTLAYGWTKFALYQNLIAVTILIPLLFWATLVWGAVGAASIWVILNSGYVIFSIQVLHTRLLKKEKWSWYFRDVGPPLLSAFVVGLLGRWFLPSPTSIPITLLSVLFIAGLALLTSIFFTFFTKSFYNKGSKI